MLTDPLALYDLRLTTPRLQLRLPDRDELAALAQLAAEGIHPVDRMPFTTPWTAQEPSLVASSVVRHHHRALGAFAAQNFTLPLVVFLDDEPIGVQSVSARQLAITREVRTGSWLGLRHQGQGHGTQAREAVLTLAFGHLNALYAVTSAFLDNPAAMCVSAKLGYDLDGVERLAVQGQLRIAQRFRLFRGAWKEVPGVPVTIEGLGPCRPLLGLADPAVD